MTSVTRASISAVTAGAPFLVRPLDTTTDDRGDQRRRRERAAGRSEFSNGSVRYGWSMMGGGRGKYARYRRVICKAAAAAAAERLGVYAECI